MSAHTRAWTTRAARPDAGSSLVELSVTVVVASLLMACVTGVFLGGLRTIRSVDVSTSSVADARLAMETVSRSLRVAYQPPSASAAVVSATPSSLSFWALLNTSGAPSTTEPAPTLVQYSYDGRCLNQTQTRAGATRTSCLVRTARAPLFTYYPTGALDAGGAGPAAIDATPQVRTADLNTIQSVQVAVTVQDPDRPGTVGVPVTVQVTLANVVAATAAGA
jgi:Tfp pilus assembly protein PilW